MKKPGLHLRRDFGPLLFTGTLLWVSWLQLFSSFHRFSKGSSSGGWLGHFFFSHCFVALADPSTTHHCVFDCGDGGLSYSAFLSLQRIIQTFTGKPQTGLYIVEPGRPRGCCSSSILYGTSVTSGWCLISLPSHH